MTHLAKQFLRAVPAALLVSACGAVEGMDPSDPARGPGQLVGNGEPITDGDFPGGDDTIPEPAAVAPPAAGAVPDCDQACRDYCDGLDLQNPVNRGVCRSLWGVGLATRPVDRVQACRRLHVDLIGRYPTAGELRDRCADSRPWSEVVRELQATPDYVLTHQRRWADRLLYNITAVNLERIYDADELVGKTYEGRVPWDLFASVTSAHPVLTRRFDTAGDRAEVAFNLFVGRPPYADERSDLAALYRHWENGYFDHPYLGRVPDAFVRYDCAGESDQDSEQASARCTSVKWGHHALVLNPDSRTDDEGFMWSGFLKAEEWADLQLPGKVLSSQPEFWEAAAEEALTRMLGYSLGTDVPAVRSELSAYLLAQQADIRALDFAVATSAVYLQASAGPASSEGHRWTYGPFKQIEVEPWIDSIKMMTGAELSSCDHRISTPNMLLDEEEGTNWGWALLDRSRWEIADEGDWVRGDYRDLARTLGGCPTNEAGGRFTTVSILNTAVQEAFLVNVCDPGMEDHERAADARRLVPEGVEPNARLSTEVGRQVLHHQSRTLLGRAPTEEELALVDDTVAACNPGPCTAESFARPLCFAMLSSSEMLFY